MSARVVHCMREPDYDVYIGRGRCPQTGKQGRWGNPFSHKEESVARYRVATRQEAVEAHKIWLWRQINEGRITIEELAELDGKALGCWCGQNKPCHGHNLVAAAAWAARQIGPENRR